MYRGLGPDRQGAAEPAEAARPPGLAAPGRRRREGRRGSAPERPSPGGGRGGRAACRAARERCPPGRGGPAGGGAGARPGPGPHGEGRRSEAGPGRAAGAAQGRGSGRGRPVGAGDARVLTAGRTGTRRAGSGCAGAAPRPAPPTACFRSRPDWRCGLRAGLGPRRSLHRGRVQRCGAPL